MLLVSSIALAASFTHDSATHNWQSQVSGTPGTITEHVVNSSRGLHKIIGWEKSDAPITFAIYESSLNPDNAASVRAAQVEARSWTSATGSLKSATLGSDRAAVAIQACINNDRIKGLRLWGKTVKSNGELGNGETQAEYKRTNCGKNDWKQKLSCASDRVITGVRFHSLNATKGFTGVAIRCSKIK